jgi:DNA mismatch repair protein MutH
MGQDADDSCGEARPFLGGGASWEASGLDRGLWIVYSGRATLPDYERESDSALVWSPGKNGEAVAFFHFS